MTIVALVFAVTTGAFFLRSPSGTPTYTSTGADSASRSVTSLAWIGGETTSFKMSDNPYTLDH